MRSGVRVGCWVIGGLLGGAALAQSGRDPVAAEALFQQGKVSWAQGRWQEACARFEASMALDPSVSVLLKIARCKEHEGKLAQAWLLYQQTISLNQDVHRDRPARREELDTLALQEIKALEPRLPRLSVAVSPTPTGLEIRRDGVVLPLASLGESIPVDPGEHLLDVVAPGFARSQLRITMAEGEQRSETLTLEPLPPVLPSASASPEPTASASFTREQTPPRRPHSRTSIVDPGVRISGLGLGAAGLVALGAAGYFGLETIRLVKASASECTRENECTGRGLLLREEARAAQTKGLIFLGVGAVFAGAGGVLWWSSQRDTSAGLSVGLGGVSLKGTW